MMIYIYCDQRIRRNKKKTERSTIMSNYILMARNDIIQNITASPSRIPAKVSSVINECGDTRERIISVSRQQHNCTKPFNLIFSKKTNTNSAPNSKTLLKQHKFPTFNALYTQCNDVVR